jgi:hypothetical protein
MADKISSPTPELASCPFCGWAAVAAPRCADKVTCSNKKNCYLSTCFFYPKEWNRRVTPPVQPAVQGMDEQKIFDLFLEISSEAGKLIPIQGVDYIPKQRLKIETLATDGLGAADRLRSELQALRITAQEREAHPRIADRCPSCGGPHLFIGTGGWLTCGSLDCKEPGLSRAIESKVTRLEAEVARLRGALEKIREHVFFRLDKKTAGEIFDMVKEALAPQERETHAEGMGSLPVGAVATVEDILIEEYANSPQFECGNVAEKIVRALAPQAPASPSGSALLTGEDAWNDGAA